MITAAAVSLTGFDPLVGISTVNPIMVANRDPGEIESVRVFQSDRGYNLLEWEKSVGRRSQEVINRSEL